MYKEIKVLLKEVAKTPSYRNDGELWTAVVGGIVTTIWFAIRHDMFPKIRDHFGDLLSVTSIIFGFALTALFFHIEAIGNWQKHPTIWEIGRGLVTNLVFTIFCLLVQVAYILTLWMVDVNLFVLPGCIRAVLYGFLVFLTLYCGCQILNHALTVWWAFNRREMLTGEGVQGNNSSSE